MTDVLTLQEAAALLRCSADTVRLRAMAGELAWLFVNSIITSKLLINFSRNRHETREIGTKRGWFEAIKHEIGTTKNISTSLLTLII